MEILISGRIFGFFCLLVIVAAVFYYIQRAKGTWDKRLVKEPIILHPKKKRLLLSLIDWISNRIKPILRIPLTP